MKGIGDFLAHIRTPTREGLVRVDVWTGDGTGIKKHAGVLLMSPVDAAAFVELVNTVSGRTEAMSAFEEVLPVLKSGGKARRGVWAQAGVPVPSRRGMVLEVIRPSLDDGRQLMPQLVIGTEDGVLRPFAGANWDLLADDWEVVSTGTIPKRQETP